MSDSGEHRFDSILLALAEQHKEGVPEVISITKTLASNVCDTYNQQMHNNMFVILVARNVSWIFSTQNRFFCWWKRW